MFGIKKIKGYLAAMSPIIHQGDEKTGSEALFNRQRVFIHETNRIEELPFISGNAIRGIWRRLLMKDFMNQLDDYKCNQRLYHMLFSGGLLEAVSEKESGTIDLELKEKVREFIKPIALLGAMYKNQNFEGKLKVGQVIPICQEYKSFLPEDLSPKYHSLLNKSIHVFRNFQFQTRKDDLREERKEGEQAIQMLIRYEVLISGTIFYHELRIIDSDEMMESVLARILELWNANATLGGNSSIGFGQVVPDYDLKTSSERYLAFNKKNKEDIIEILDLL